MRAKHFPHHPDQTQGTGIANPVIDAVGILAGCEDVLVSKDRKVLGNIALRGTDLIDDFLNELPRYSQEAMAP